MYKREGSTLRVVPATLSVYYKDNNHCTGHETPLHKMPVGLRIIAGDARRNRPINANDAACGGDHLEWGEAVNGKGSGFPSTPYTRTDMWQVSIYFPNCWDGHNLNPPDNVVYPEGNQCPSSHPYRIPKLLGEVHYWVKQMGGSRGDYILSSRQGGEGGTTDHDGWTAHMDFIAGWNADMLDAAIKTCLNDLWTEPHCPFAQFNHNGIRPGVPTTSPGDYHKQRPTERVNDISKSPHDNVHSPISGDASSQFKCDSGSMQLPKRPSSKAGSCRDHVQWSMVHEGKSCAEALAEVKSHCSNCTDCSSKACATSHGMLPNCGMSHDEHMLSNETMSHI